MTHEALPKYGWGRVKNPCEGCPTGVTDEGELFCRHPWRVIIAHCAEVVTDEKLAECWDKGASIMPIGETAHGQRPSIELSVHRPEEALGIRVFRII